MRRLLAAARGLPRRLLVAGVAALALVLVAVVALAARGESGPPDTAARLVPATALLYAHLSTDPDRDADAELFERLAAFPAARAAQQRLTRAIGRDFDLTRDVRPWLGDEAAFALLDSGGTRADSLLLLAVRDRSAAEAFLGRVEGSRGTTTHRGVPIRRFQAVSAAFVADYLAVGQDAAVRTAIDRSQRRGAPFTEAVAYTRVAEDRPGDRVLDVVMPAEGVTRVLAPAPGALGALGGLLSHPELVSVSASLVPEEDGFRLHVRQARNDAPAREFEPSLHEEVPRAAAAYLGVTGLDAFAALVPAGDRDALATALADALGGTGLDLERDLLAPLRGEVALSVTPGQPVPTVTLVARTSDEERTRETLARLQQPLAERLGAPPAPGAPQATFEQRELGDVPAFTLEVAPGFALTYAVAGDRLVVSTQVNGVGHVLAERDSLADSDAFGRALGDLPEQVEALGFIDLGQLLALVEQAGSSGDPAFEALREDLRRIRVAGAVVRADSSRPDDSTAELFFEIP